MARRRTRGIRKMRSGYQIRWTDAAGVRRAETFRTFGDAEFILRKRLGEVEEVKRGLRGLAPDRHTFDELADVWLDGRAKLRRTGPKSDASILRCHLRPFFGAMELRAIGPAQIEAFKGSRRGMRTQGTNGGRVLSDAAVNHHLGLLRTMLGHAVEIGWLDFVPRIKKHRAIDVRWRFLHPVHEVPRFLRAARELGELPFVLYAMAIYSGLRAGELAGLRWADVELDEHGGSGRRIRVSRSYDGPTTKSGRERQVPIFDPLLPILREWRLRSRGPLVFTTARGTMLRKCSRVFREVLTRTIERAGLPPRHICFHSLRHTFGTFASMRGVEPIALKAFMGHADLQTTNRYSHFAPEALSRYWGALGPPIDLAGADVVTLPGPSASGVASSASRLASPEAPEGRSKLA